MDPINLGELARRLKNPDDDLDNRRYASGAKKPRMLEEAIGMGCKAGHCVMIMLGRQANKPPAQQGCEDHSICPYRWYNLENGIEVDKKYKKSLYLDGCFCCNLS
jgi:hypothetical protein